AVTQLLIGRIVINGVKRSASRQSELTPPVRTPDFDQFVRLDPQFHLGFLWRSHFVRFSLAVWQSADRRQNSLTQNVIGFSRIVSAPGSVGHGGRTIHGCMGCPYSATNANPRPSLHL